MTRPPFTPIPPPAQPAPFSREAPPEWARLAAIARRAAAADARATAAPCGFAVRVVARALGIARPAAASLFARFSLRALGFACLLALASVALNYGAIVNAMQEDIAVLGEPVALVDATDQAS